jgi:anthranilate phosphoribosyltransferase
VVEVADGGTEEWFIAPEDLGLQRVELGRIAGGDPADNAATVRSVFSGERGPARDVVCVNAGAAILAAGGAHDLAAGAERAREVIDSGAAEGVLERLIRLTSKLAP